MQRLYGYYYWATIGANDDWANNNWANINSPLRGKPEAIEWRDIYICMGEKHIVTNELINLFYKKILLWF